MSAKTRAKTPEGILRAAARYIRKHGWHQRGYVGKDGGVCAFGAINAVLTGSPVSIGNSRGAENLLYKRIGKRSVVMWNDTPGRTVHEVLAALEGKA